MNVADTSGHDAYAAFREPGYRLYWSGNLLALLGMQMQATTVFWEANRRTGDPWMISQIGLVQFLPVLLLSIPAGQLADRYPRKSVVMWALVLLIIGSGGLAWASYRDLPFSIHLACLFLIGVARAVQQPAKASLAPDIVPRERFANAVAWNGTGFQLASVLGPVMAGVLLADFAVPAVVYLIEAFTGLVFLGLLRFVPVRTHVPSSDAMSVASVLAGLNFVWSNPIILAAITLDLFAVLLGGATAMYPAYADHILHLTPKGYGLMNTMFAAGAILTALWLAHRPPMQNAGWVMLGSVALFGLGTVLFGLSGNYQFSFVMLFLLGASDMVSVVIRHTSLQLQTPDSMRGRVSAINGIFIGASNQLGAFRSGLVAKMFERRDDPAFGPMVSVISGGIGTILVVLWATVQWPELRRYKRLDETHSKTESEG